MHYLYKITNQLNNKVYIGQTVDIHRRRHAHQSYAKNPERTCQYIHRAMSKYGVENFTLDIIDFGLDKHQADCLEINYIIQFDSRNPEKGYNFKPGGKTWDDNFRQIMSEKHKQYYVDHPEKREEISIQFKKMWENIEIRRKEL